MKRGSRIERKTPLRAHNKIRVAGKSDTAELKREIQSLLRQIVIARDGGCILRHVRHCSDTVLQADHLITRANSATYADARLVVCVCRSCHAWKSLGSNRNKAQYDALVRAILPPTRVALWDASELESWRPHPMRASDWKLAVVVLKNELALLFRPESPDHHTVIGVAQPPGVEMVRALHVDAHVGGVLYLYLS